MLGGELATSLSDVLRSQGEAHERLSHLCAGFSALYSREYGNPVLGMRTSAGPRNEAP